MTEYIILAACFAWVLVYQGMAVKHLQTVRTAAAFWIVSHLILTFGPLAIFAAWKLGAFTI